MGQMISINTSKGFQGLIISYLGVIYNFFPYRGGKKIKVVNKKNKFSTIINISPQIMLSYPQDVF